MGRGTKGMRNLLLPLVVLSAIGARAQTPEYPNLIVLVADDFGVDLMPSYGEGADLPCTPHLDRFTDQGMLFRNAWAAPMCSPTRAMLQTGRHGFRTGIGTPGGGGAVLGLSETSLPEQLGHYNSALLGKWHLGGNSNTHPLETGYDQFLGPRGNVPDYFNWTKVINGSTVQTTVYATTDTSNDAVTAMLTMPEPWLLVVNYNAPHGPTHAPDASLCPTDCQANLCQGVTDNSPNWQKARAMVGALDTEIGRVLRAVDAVDPDAYVFFVGDNGTAGGATRAPFNPQKAKTTLYEGGINVPLVVRGPGVKAGSECQGLVSVVDLFATLAELGKRPSLTEDSVSMVPYFNAPELSLRQVVFSESFTPNHQPSLPFQNHQRAIRGERYKLIRRTGQPDELYDLWNDPFENVDLYPNLVQGTPANDAYWALVRELIELGVD